MPLELSADDGEAPGAACDARGCAWTVLFDEANGCKGMAGDWGRASTIIVDSLMFFRDASLDDVSDE